MTALSALFNAHSSMHPDPGVIAHATRAFQSEQLDFKVERIFESCNVTKKIDGTGYNVVIDREENETRKQWAERTKESAEFINKNLEGAKTTQETFGSGRIHLSVTPGSKADRFLEGHVEMHPFADFPNDENVMQP